MKKTVIMLHYGDDGIRGSEICFVESVIAFANNGIDVIVCRKFEIIDSYITSYIGYGKILDFEFPEIMFAGVKETAFPLFSYIRSLKMLRGFVKKWKPDLIYCNSGLPCQLAVPVGRLSRIPVLCHFHHPAIKRAYYLWLVFLADKVIFPSQFTKRHSENKANVTGEVIYNGVDLNRFYPAGFRDFSLRTSMGIDEHAIVIGQVAQLTEHKRPDFLIHAFVSLLKRSDKPIHLCLVGKGPMEFMLRELIVSLGITKHVSITGVVEDVLPYYQHVFDINVLVSREEGLGISAIEGSACGLPVVVTRCTGLIETVVENETGFFFEKEMSEDLCEKLLCLIGNQSLRKSMGLAGRAYAQEKFSASVNGQALIDVANRVIEGRAR